MTYSRVSSNRRAFDHVPFALHSQRSHVQLANRISGNEEMRNIRTSSSQDSQRRDATEQLTSSITSQSTAPTSRTSLRYPSPYVVNPIIPPYAADIRGNILPIKGQDSQNLVGAWGLLHVAMHMIEKTTAALRGEQTMTNDDIKEIDAFCDL